MLRRRGFLGLLATPAIVRVASIMPVALLPLAMWEKQERVWALLYGVSDERRIENRIWRKYSQHPDHFLDRWHMGFLSGDNEPSLPGYKAAMAEARRLRLLRPQLLADSPYLMPESGWPGPYVDGTYHPEVKMRSPWHPERATWVEGVPC